MNNDQNDIQWSFLTELINMGKCTPILADSLTQAYLFPNDNVSAAWAEQIKYPLPDKDDLARVAQYLSVTSGDEFLAKTNYLAFIKQRLIANAYEGQDQSLFLDELSEELPRLTVSQVAKRLGFHNFEDRPENPLFVLANLPLPVYLTTSSHLLLEEALLAAGKEPHVEYYRWSEELEEDFYTNDTAMYRPTIERPLVYHLFGLDSHPASLVLTEENYFEFFEHISHGLERSEGVPNAARSALASTALVLLGYDLQSWGFRVLFRGPIRAVFNRRRPLSLSIQLEPQPAEGISDTHQARHYLSEYFRGYKFSIYWGDTNSFIKELWRRWEG